MESARRFWWGWSVAQHQLLAFPRAGPEVGSFLPGPPDTSSSTSYGVQPLSPHQPPQGIVLL